MDVGAYGQAPALQSHQIGLGRERSTKALEGFARLLEMAVPGADLDEPSPFAEREGDVEATFGRALDQDCLGIDLSFGVPGDDSERFLDHLVEARQIRGIVFHSLDHSIPRPIPGAATMKGAARGLPEAPGPP